MPNSVNQIVLAGPRQLTMPIERAISVAEQHVSSVARMWIIGVPRLAYRQLNDLFPEIAKSHPPEVSVPAFYSELERVVVATAHDFYELWHSAEDGIGVWPNTHYRSIENGLSFSNKVVCALDPIHDANADARKAYATMARADCMDIASYVGCT